MSRWIPISEGFPHPRCDGKYFLATDICQGKIRVDQVIWNASEGSFDFVNDDLWEECHPQIIAYMENPKPYI